jgi:hypothetical protein
LIGILPRFFAIPAIERERRVRLDSLRIERARRACNARTALNLMAKSGRVPIRACRPHAFGKSGSDRLQEFNEVSFLSPSEFQLELPIVVIDHVQKIQRTSIVKIRRMLPESAQRCGAILSCGSPQGIRRVRADLRRIVQEWPFAAGTAQHVRKIRRLVVRWRT